MIQSERSYVRILGARGSVPISGSDFHAYGGATTCIQVCLSGQSIILDAGTGILKLPSEVMELSTLPLLITHAHLDHINGLSMCPYAMQAGKELHIYSALSGVQRMEDVLRRLYSPPIWPLQPEQFPANLIFHTLDDEMELGPVRIHSMEGVHPGGVRLIRLDADGKSVVFATDCTLTDGFLPKAAAFAMDCDLLICDGQYSDAEWETHAGFGHNTWKMAARFASGCCAKSLAIVHHDPGHTDSVLDAAAREIKDINPLSRFAHEGEVIEL